MNKLFLITKREFFAKVRNRSFIIMTFLSPLLIVLMTGLIVFLNKTNSENVRKIAFIDNSYQLSVALKNSKSITYVDLTATPFEEAIRKTKDFYSGLIYIPKTKNLDELSQKIQFYSSESPGIELIQNIENKLSKRIEQLKMKELNIDYKLLQQTATKVTITTENFEGDQSSEKGNILKMVIGGGLGYLIFMFIVIYGGSVMRSVIEEKTSRIIEVIISSVKPFQLMLGKIIGNGLAAILQFSIWVIIGIGLLIIANILLGVDATTSMNTMPSDALESLNKVPQKMNVLQEIILEIDKLPIFAISVSFIIYFLGGYLIYSSIYAAIGAAVDNETDTQQFMLPVLLPLTIAIYIGFSVIGNPNGPIAIGFSLFPLTSPIVMLMRIPFGVPWWELLISIVLLVLTFLFMVWFASKIYRVGILMYGKKPSYKELYKWLRY
ncbi:MAG: ABC transporter permease [Flavobacteriaceae bacterium]|nr:ABC transporter permease [Flavobacteriaceae bacterium]